MQLLSINVGMPRQVEWKGSTLLTGIFKEPLPPDRAVWVRHLNIDGDGQADLKYHGGVDKAVYGYSADAFPWWKETLGREVGPGDFGENLTFSVLDEASLCVGDVLRIGGVELQVIQPRLPCSKLGMKFDDMGILKTFLRSRRPGIYFRVAQEGQLRVGDEVTIVSRDPERIPLVALIDIHVGTLRDTDLLQRALKVGALNEDWREAIEKRLRKHR